MLKKEVIALVNERYNDAAAVFWGGSLAEGKGTNTSDIDLVVIYEDISNAYREAFMYEGTPYDVFIHSIPTLRYFFKEKEIPSGMPALMNMILKRKEITPRSLFSHEVKRIAQKYYDLGPAKWGEEGINKERFFITDVLDDIIAPKSKHEQMAASSWLYEALGQFYLRSNNRWSGSGKTLARRIVEEDQELAEEFEQAFTAIFHAGDPALLAALVDKILKPFGGRLWAGFREDAPKEWRAN